MTTNTVLGDQTMEALHSDNNSILIELKNVHRSFTMGEEVVRALNGIDLKIKKGEIVVILGPSGSGKTTLLNQIGGIDVPDKGNVIIEGQDLTSLSKKKLTNYRGKKIGWVFQFFNLIPSLTAKENVALGLELSKDFNNMEQRSEELLTKLGLGEHLNRFPSQLSGGQQQRIAFARALVKKPLIIAADEPTGNLDKKTGLEVVNLMRKINEEDNVTFLIVSHDSSLTSVADRVLHIEDGKILKEETRSE